MYVKEIEIGRYRHLENVSFGPFRVPEKTSSLVVLAGPNGGGKSSVLELVSKALSDSWSLTYQLNRAAPESSFEVTFGVSSRR
jgi:predicted ATP-binding protein involved in virulence